MLGDVSAAGKYGGGWRRIERNGIVVWERVMPPISPRALQCVFYLYPSEAEALAGDSEGGCGFLVCIPSDQHRGLRFLYAITNRHVIEHPDSPARFARFNRSDGTTDVRELTDWTSHRGGYDLSACPLESTPEHEVLCMMPDEKDEEFFVKETMLFSPGEDVVMIGRFIEYGGKLTNTPCVRFGNISMLPVEPMEVNAYGAREHLFLVEMRSLSGFSGSPVMLMRNPGPNLAPDLNVHREWFLGIDEGHLDVYEPVRDQNTKLPVRPAQCVRVNSGMTRVIPAWRLTELLQAPTFIEQRAKLDALKSKEIREARTHNAEDSA